MRTLLEYTDDVKEIFNDSIPVIQDIFNEIVDRRNPAEAYVLVKSLLDEFTERNPDPAPDETRAPTFALRPTDGFLENPLSDFLREELFGDTKLAKIDFTKLSGPREVFLIYYGQLDIKRSPFFWSRLYHEAFHILQECLERNPGQIVDFITPLSDSKDQELMIDILPTIYAGPVYPFSMIRLFEERPYRHEYESHQPMPIRIAAMWKALEWLRSEAAKNLATRKTDLEASSFEESVMASFERVLALLAKTYERLSSKPIEDIQSEVPNFETMRALGETLFDSQRVPHFSKRIANLDSSIRTSEAKMTFEKCCMLEARTIPPVAHPVFVLNGLLHVNLELGSPDGMMKKAFGTLEIDRVRKSGSLEEKLLEVLLASLRKWWAVKEFQAAQQRMSTLKGLT
jgi:hypothetical protein